jgi:FOG: HEAT repeat
MPSALLRRLAFFLTSAALAVLLASCTTPAEPSASSATATGETASTAPVAPEIDVAIAPATPPAPLESILTYTFEGDQQPLVTLENEIAAAGTDSAKLNALAARLLGFFRETTSFAARQALAQRLAQFPASALLRDDHGDYFAALLIDPSSVSIAQLALEPVPGSAVDELFVSALAKSSSRASRLALVQSIGKRRIASAVPQLAPFLTDSDPALASAAANALGQIGNARALETLLSAPPSPAILPATIDAAQSVGGRPAVRALSEIANSANNPAHLRASAHRTLLLVEPSSAPVRIVDLLAGNDPALKAVAIEAIATSPARSLDNDLSANLAKFDAPTQASVIAGLAHRKNTRLVPALTTASQHPDSSVRAAAISALGQLPGNADTARHLAQIAATGESADARLAREALSRLDGPGVADAITSGARTGDAKLRIVYLEQIASRYMIGSLPLLLEARDDPTPAIRSAALDALAVIAPASTQPAVLDWTLAAADRTEQARALRALAEITLRNPDVDARARPIVAAIDRADPATATRVVPVLQRLGGATAAQSAARLALSDNVALANAAANTLSRWTDRTGLAPLISVAQDAPSDAARTRAIQAAIRFLERYRELPSAELTDSLSRLLAVTRDHADRERLVFLLSRASDEAALALARKLASDEALAASAADAALAIEASLAGKPVIKASSGNWGVANMLDGKLDTRWITSVEAGRTLEIDFHRSRPLRRLTLDQGASGENFPEHLEIFVSDDPAHFGDPVASVSGSPNQTVIDLPAHTRGRHVLIKNTADRVNGWWTICELYID